MADQRAPCHIPNAELAVHALDGGRTAWSAPAARHLSVCPLCRERLTAYERVVEAGRLTYPGDVLQAPSPRVWDQVRAHVAADRARTPPGPCPAVRNLLLRAGRQVLRGASAVLRVLFRRLVRPRRPRT
ncbi:hypothetical protein QFZ75_000430 [Streptomyces sp. V3I8]|uniref:hypothetical protein n=1 Tax=Streptomyces sp. V3I8 TaxID=3042279 RepID=UPI0027805EE7|nr:hypothetical protein [Streptomyces sp. V3I8]MDQ1034014.1 hypothetical protein [Streptomyces sp. V3I8]